MTPLVVLRGAATASLVALPAALINSALIDQTPKPDGAIAISFVVVFVGFVLGGWLAGREASVEPAKHGAVAAAIAFVPVELVAILGRLDRGDPIRVLGIIIYALLAACCGTIGARIGARGRTNPIDGSDRTDRTEGTEAP